MRSLKITLVTVAIQSTAATFTQEGGNAEGAMTEHAHLEVPKADALLAGSVSHDTPQRVQEVLQNDGSVEDHKTVSQITQILNPGVIGYSAEPVHPAVHDESSAESSIHIANVETVKGPLYTNIWEQSLGKAMELAKVKAGELQLERVAIDIGEWVEAHPWKAESNIANWEPMTGPFDREFWGQSLGKALELAKFKARELHLEQVAADIERWVEEHPWQAGFYAASFVGFFAPAILSIPALEALGFGVAGVRAGTFVLLLHRRYCRASTVLILEY